VLVTFSSEQVSRLIHCKPIGRNQSRVCALALTALDSGLRINELLSLSRKDVNLDSLTLLVQGKGNKQRVVPMSIELRKVLYRHLTSHQHNLVFCTKEGRKLLHGNVRRDFQIVCRKVGIAGVRCSFHTLRHSFAVGYLRRGGNLEFLRRILGHNSILTTQKYLRSLGVEDLKEVHNGLSMLSR
jgi:integrase/recombinase XerD